MKKEHTPGPWYVGAQNDMLYITAGRSPSPDNDYPNHEAQRVVLAKVYDGQSDDALPVDATANAQLLAVAPRLADAMEYLIELADEAMRKANASGAWYDPDLALRAPRALLKEAGREE